MKRVTTRHQLQDIAAALGMRPDWHEPDEEGVHAKVHGTTFDNAGFWPLSETWNDGTQEIYVVLYKEGEPIAAVNLATLFSWACDG